MTTVHGTVKFASVNSLPKDATQVGFTFHNPTDTPAALAAVGDGLIEAFFNTLVTPLGSIMGNFLGKQISRTGGSAVNTWYDLTPVSPANVRQTNPSLGPPIAVHAWSPATLAITGHPLPSEVACCLSFHGATTGIAEDEAHDPVGPKGDLHPAASRRGRIYLGPLDASVVTDPGDGIPGVSSEFAALVTGRAAILMASGAWSVWSRRQNFAYAVTGGFVDDAFDTQRRRGELATARTTFGAP